MNTDKSVNVLLNNTRDLIAHNKLEKALDSMKTLLIEHNASLKAEYNEYLHLSSNYYANEEKERKGVNDDYDKKRNKFIVSFLKLTDIIEESLKQLPEQNQKLKITIEIEADFKNFPESDFLKRLQTLLKTTDDNIKITDTREGSVILDMEIDADLLSKLMALIKLGLIKDVRDIKILNKAWNTYIKTKDSLPILLQNTDLREANLSKADLRGANLGGMDLSEANLRGADLSETNLSGANLRGADLSETNLRGADLHGTYLSEANLGLANLSKANLSRANLSFADLSKANFSNADLRYVDFSNADLKYVDFSNADLSNTNLRNANLPKANLSKADINNADLRNANLIGSDLRGANLTRTDLRGANLSDKFLGKADLREANLNNSKFLLSQKQTLIDMGVDVSVIDFIPDDGDPTATGSRGY